MKKFLALFLLGALLFPTGNAWARAEGFDDFFDEAVFLPKDYQSRCFIDGWHVPLYGPVVEKDGVVYVSMTLLARIIDCEVSCDTASGRCAYAYRRPGQYSWRSEDYTALVFTAGANTVVSDGQWHTLTHAPYLFTQANGTVYVMAPLAEMTQIMGKVYTEKDGLVIISDTTPPQDAAAQYGQILALLTQPFVGHNLHYLTGNDGEGITIAGGGRTTPVGTQALREGALMLEELSDFDAEGRSQTFAVFVYQMVNGQKTLLCSLPTDNLRIEDENGTVYYSDIYRFHTPMLIENEAGRFLLVNRTGASAMSARQILLRLNDDQTVTTLAEEPYLAHLFAREHALYFVKGQLHGIPPLAVRLDLTTGEERVLTDDVYSFTQIADGGEQMLGVAALVGKIGAFDRQYALCAMDWDTEAITVLSEITPTWFDDNNGRDYFYLENGRIYFKSADNGLYSIALDGSDERQIISAPIGGKPFNVGANRCFIGADRALYQIHAEGAAKIAARIIDYAVLGDTLYYIADGYAAGFYAWNGRQNQRLANGFFKALALNGDGHVVLLPFDQVADYYVYDGQKLTRHALR